MLLFVCFILSPPPPPPSFSLADFKNRSKIFSPVDRDVTTFRFPRIPVRMTSSPKGLSSFIFTYFSVYGVSPFKYSFNFSHKSVMVICSSFSAQYLTTCVKASGQFSYVFRSAFLNTSSLHFSRATEDCWNAFWFVFALKLMFHSLWYNASAHGLFPFVLWPSSEHACASFS